MTGAVVLVEGVSDKLALESLAARRGRDLAAEGVMVVPMGGAKGIGAYLVRYGPAGSGLRLAGLCDENEEADVARALERAGLGRALTRPDLEALGFFVCVEDLEDELIRALGPATVERIVADVGEAGRWRTFKLQPAKRDVPVDRQLRRFIGTRSGGKIQYAPLLVEALDLDRVPRPLDGVLGHV